jgi:hypothetical protein
MDEEGKGKQKKKGGEMKFFFSGGAVGEFALFALDHGIFLYQQKYTAT